jgi:hypothetical protein
MSSSWDEARARNQAKRLASRPDSLRAAEDGERLRAQNRRQRAATRPQPESSTAAHGRVWPVVGDWTVKAAIGLAFVIMIVAVAAGVRWLQNDGPWETPPPYFFASAAALAPLVVLAIVLDAELPLRPKNWAGTAGRIFTRIMAGLAGVWLVALVATFVLYYAPEDGGGSNRACIQYDVGCPPGPGQPFRP